MHGSHATGTAARRLWPALLLAASLLICGPNAMAQAVASPCGPIENAYGPFDYRTDRDKLAIVERFHFTPEVEAGLRGKSGRVGDDLDYTLRAFPNHHRALIAVMRYGEKLKSPQPSDLPRSVECYFDRALQFRSDDVVARMIYAKFLTDHRRAPDAVSQLQIADRLARHDARQQSLHVRTARSDRDA